MDTNKHVFDGYAGDIQKKIRAGDGINVDNDTVSVSATLKKYGESDGKPTFNGEPIGTGEDVATKDWVKSYVSPFEMDENGHLLINTSSEAVEIDDRGHAIITIQGDLE